ncbi:MAG TPA: DUF4097 family beta strand repeat-containing protein [Ktedonobacteraceae bacterium]|nr:DUF4097 family beta strand repeat-containing protein [Ktedonobacteraceae bacterium]
MDNTPQSNVPYSDWNTPNLQDYPPLAPYQYPQSSWADNFGLLGILFVRGCGPRTWGCLISLLLLITLGTGIVFFAGTILAIGPTTITVSSHPLLILNNDTYNNAPTIHIHSGARGNQIVLQPASFPFHFVLPYDQTPDHSTLIVDTNAVASQLLDITVPATTDLKISTNSGNIEVNGVSGQMVLLSNGGSITVTNSILSNASLLNANTGMIKVLQSTLSGPVTFSNNQGTTIFAGSIAAQGNYQFLSNQGAIDVTLPRTASFHIDAEVTNGSITADFPGVQVQQSAIHDDVGTPPRAQLTLQNNADIHLHAAKGA